MSDDPRQWQPDPESGPPEPIPPTETAPDVESDAPDVEERAATATVPAAGRAPGYAQALSAVLPGSGHFALGAWIRGVGFLVPWALGLAIIFLARQRLGELFTTGSLDDYVAVTSLALTMAVVWGAAFVDLRRPSSAADRAGDSQWRIASRHFKKDPLAVTGLIITLLLYLIAFLAPLIAPYDPIAQRDIVATGFLGPSFEHWLGTDRFGRDVLSRMIYGARISLAIGFIAVAISVSLGTLIGAVAGYFGGKIDGALMRFTDMVLAFPRLVLLIMIIALFSPGITLIILVLGLTLWPRTARIVRGEVLSLKEREFVDAARVLGMGRARIVLRHVIPNVLAPVIVAATLGIGNTIVLEAGLSFLGLGVQPPTPSWGNMVSDGRQNLIGAWWVATFPGLAIVLTVLAFNLMGDGLRDALDPRLRT